MVPKAKHADSPAPKPKRPNFLPIDSSSGFSARANGIEALVVLPNRPPALSTRPRNPRSRHIFTIDSLSVRYGLVQRDEVEIFEAPAGLGQNGVDGGSAHEGDEDLSNRGAIHRQPLLPGVDLVLGRGGPFDPPAG